MNLCKVIIKKTITLCIDKRPDLSKYRERKEVKKCLQYILVRHYN